MTTLKELACAVSNNDMQKMQKKIAPFCDYLGLKEVSYWRVTREGKYSYVGSQNEWTKYSMEYFHPVDFPCIRYPDDLSPGVSLMRITSNENYRRILEKAWTQFGINIAMCIQYKTPDAIEAFGFCTNHNHDRVEETLLRELPLIYKFIEYYKKENANIIHQIHECQVDISSNLESLKQDPEKMITYPEKREHLLQHYGWAPIEQLSSRELEIIQYLASGFPANYIAKEIHLSVRTVENYIANIKSKLDCNSKVALIKKSKELNAVTSEVRGNK